MHGRPCPVVIEEFQEVWWEAPLGASLGTRGCVPVSRWAGLQNGTPQLLAGGNLLISAHRRIPRKHPKPYFKIPSLGCFPTANGALYFLPPPPRGSPLLRFECWLTVSSRNPGNFTVPQGPPGVVTTWASLASGVFYL